MGCCFEWFTIVTLAQVISCGSHPVKALMQTQTSWLLTAIDDHPGLHGRPGQDLQSNGNNLERGTGFLQYQLVTLIPLWVAHGVRSLAVLTSGALMGGTFGLLNTRAPFSRTGRAHLTLDYSAPSSGDWEPADDALVDLHCR